METPYIHSIDRHDPSGRLYFTVCSEGGRILRLSDELSQEEADAITYNPDTWPDTDDEYTEWARTQVFRTVRHIGIHPFR